MSGNNLTVETLGHNAGGNSSIVKIAKRGEYICSKKKLDELFFRWISQANVQAEIRQLVSLVRNGKKTNLVRLKEALSPTKEPPRSPTSAGHGRATKNIFANQSSAEGGNRVLRFGNGGSEDTTVDEGADTDVLLASSANERLARKAATLMNDVDEGTKQQKQEDDSSNQDNAPGCDWVTHGRRGSNDQR